jgi:hypothetical protein
MSKSKRNLDRLGFSISNSSYLIQLCVRTHKKQKHMKNLLSLLIFVIGTFGWDRLKIERRYESGLVCINQTLPMRYQINAGTSNTGYPLPAPNFLFNFVDINMGTIADTVSNFRECVPYGPYPPRDNVFGDISWSFSKQNGLRFWSDRPGGLFFQGTTSSWICLMFDITRYTPYNFNTTTYRIGNEVTYSGTWATNHVFVDTTTIYFVPRGSYC